MKGKRRRAIGWAYLFSFGLLSLGLTSCMGHYGGCGGSYDDGHAHGGGHAHEGPVAQGPSKAAIGTVLGGVAGGVGGTQIGSGHGRIAAITGGTFLGAIVGHEIGRSIDETDELKARDVLEKNQTGHPVTWANPDTGAEVAMTPTRTFLGEDERYCREYATEVIVGGEKQQAYGTACRQPDGSWKVRN